MALLSEMQEKLIVLESVARHQEKKMQHLLDRLLGFMEGLEGNQRAQSIVNELEVLRKEHEVELSRQLEKFKMEQNPPNAKTQ